MCKSQADLHEHVEADVFETHVHKLIREVPPNLLKGIFLIIFIPHHHYHSSSSLSSLIIIIIVSHLFTSVRLVDEVGAARSDGGGDGVRAKGGKGVAVVHVEPDLIVMMIVREDHSRGCT